MVWKIPFVFLCNVQVYDVCDFMKDVFSVSWVVSPLPTLVFATECVTGQDPELLE